ncbi:MAG: EF-Tu/IF-2/RF-3 family GTPase, partial [candidate division WOR-3 bacterium]
SVAAIKITNGELKKGDEIHIKGHTTDLNQKVESMQKEHKEIEVAFPGDEIGLKVIEHVREGDTVYKVIPE